MFEPKVPTLGAAVGFVLSFVIGLFSGVPISLIIIRAILMSVFFAVLSVGAFLLLKKFLPELLDDSSSSISDFENKQGAVDITIDDSPSDILSSGLENGDFNAEMMPDFITSEEKSQKSDILTGSNELNTGIPDFKVLNSKELDTIETKESTKFIPGLHVTSVSSTEVKNKPVHSIDGLDVLPDLQDFVTAIPSVNDTMEDESDSFGSSGKESSSLFSENESGSSSNEAATMAKAIRTILAREN